MAPDVEAPATAVLFGRHHAIDFVPSLYMCRLDSSEHRSGCGSQATLATNVRCDVQCHGCETNGRMASMMRRLGWRKSLASAERVVRWHREDAAGMGNARRLLAGAIVAGLCLTGALNAAAGSDGTTPKPPEVVLKQSSTTALLFTWSATPGERTTGYEVYFGDVRVGPTTFTRADFQNLACNKRYVFRLIAFDGAGHRSAPSVTFAQTSPCSASPATRSDPSGSNKGDTPRPTPQPGSPAPTPAPAPIRRRWFSHPYLACACASASASVFWFGCVVGCRFEWVGHEFMLACSAVQDVQSGVCSSGAWAGCAGWGGFVPGADDQGGCEEAVCNG